MQQWSEYDYEYDMWHITIPLLPKDIASFGIWWWWWMAQSNICPKHPIGDQMGEIWWQQRPRCMIHIIFMLIKTFTLYAWGQWTTDQDTKATIQISMKLGWRISWTRIYPGNFCCRSGQRNEFRIFSSHFLQHSFLDENSWVYLEGFHLLVNYNLMRILDLVSLNYGKQLSIVLNVEWHSAIEFDVGIGLTELKGSGFSLNLSLVCRLHLRTNSPASHHVLFLQTLLFLLYHHEIPQNPVRHIKRS